MTARRPLPRLVYGIAIAQLVSWACLYYSFAVLIVPMEASLGWSRGAITGAFTVGLMTSGLLAPFVGRLLDRRGAVVPMTGGSVLGALALLAWAATDNVMAFYAIWLVIGVAMACTFYEAGFAVVTAASGPDYRRAITIVTLIAGFAGTLAFPLTQALVGTLGWRGALVALAILNLALPGVLHATMLREDGRVARPSQPPEIAVAALRRARNSPAYWGLLAGVVANALMFSGVTFHIIPILGERGFPAARVVAAWALVGPAQVAARAILMALGTRLGTLSTGVLAFGLTIVALILLQTTWPDLLPPVLAALCFGAGNGLVTIVRAATIPDLLGREGYASIAGTIALPSMLGIAIGPTLVSLLWAQGGYALALYALLAVALAGLGAFTLGILWHRRRVAGALSGPSPTSPSA